MGSSRQSTTSNQTRDPYAPAQPALSTAATGLDEYLNNSGNFQAYSGPRVAQMSSGTQQGLTDLASNAGTQPSQNYYQGVIGGNYLNQGNPYQTQLNNSIISSVMPSINNAFSAAGLAGSTLNQTALAQGLANGIAAPEYQNYQNERGLQQQAAAAAPQLAQQQATNEIAAGQTGEAYNQENLNAAVQQYYEQQQANIAPYQNAVPLISQIGNAGGTSQSSSTTTTNPSIGQQIAGGVLTGASLFSPWTAGSNMIGGGYQMPSLASQAFNTIMGKGPYGYAQNGQFNLNNLYPGATG